MNELETRLWLREKERRSVLWKLQRLAPGDPTAKDLISALDVVEQQDRNDPIGEGAYLSVDQLRQSVPVDTVREFRVVLDSNIPEPWRERFLLASTGSTRIPEGCYIQDWLRFLRLWNDEMAHLEQHRIRVRTDD